MTYNWQKFYKFYTFKSPLIFRFFALYTYLLDDIKFCFHLSPSFTLLPSKIGMMKKNWNIAEQEILCETQWFMVLQIQIHLESWQGKGFWSYTVCGSDFSIAHGGQIDINRHKDTSKHKWYVDAAQQQRKLIDFGASSVTANLKNKKLWKLNCFFLIS